MRYLCYNGNVIGVDLMKNIQRGSITHLIILIILIGACGMIIYPLFDFIVCKFITNTKFIYSIKSHIIEPIISSSIIAIVLWIIDRKKT